MSLLLGVCALVLVGPAPYAPGEAAAPTLWQRRDVADRVAGDQAALDGCAGPGVVSAWWRVSNGRAADVDLVGEPALTPAARDCIGAIIAGWWFDGEAPRARTTLLLQASSLASLTLAQLDPALARALRPHHGGVQRCMEEAKKNGIHFETPLVVRFALQSDGVATSAQLLSSRRVAWALERCVAEQLAEVVFPPRPGTGWTVVTHAFGPPSPQGMASLRKDQIQDIIRRNVGQIQNCFEQQLALRPSLHGRVVMQWVIEAGGRVRSAVVRQSSLPVVDVEACMARRIATWTFPPPYGDGEVVVVYPFVFNGQPTR